MQRPGRHLNTRQNRPAQESPLGRDQIDRDRRTNVDDYGRPAGAAEPVDRHRVDQPVDADHVGSLQPHDKRKVARSQQHDAIAASDARAASRSAAWLPAD